MPMDALYYRREAERYRQLADAAADPEAAQRWRTMAPDYAAAADVKEAADGAHPPTMQQQRVQQQPFQQPETKLTPEDEK
jgi:hypothetical protein